MSEFGYYKFSMLLLRSIFFENSLLRAKIEMLLFCPFTVTNTIAI